MQFDRSIVGVYIVNNLPQQLFLILTEYLRRYLSRQAKNPLAAEGGLSENISKASPAEVCGVLMPLAAEGGLSEAPHIP